MARICVLFLRGVPSGDMIEPGDIELCSIASVAVSLFSEKSDRHGTAKPVWREGRMDRIYILAVAIVIAGACSGGLYSVAGIDNSSALIVNRFTGGGWYCGLGSCSPLRSDNR
jgi:hypothetical protein